MANVDCVIQKVLKREAFMTEKKGSPCVEFFFRFLRVNCVNIQFGSVFVSMDVSVLPFLSEVVRDFRWVSWVTRHFQSRPFKPCFGEFPNQGQAFLMLMRAHPCTRPIWFTCPTARLMPSWDPQHVVQLCAVGMNIPSCT